MFVRNQGPWHRTPSPRVQCSEYAQKRGEAGQEGITIHWDHGLLAIWIDDEETLLCFSAKRSQDLGTTWNWEPK